MREDTPKSVILLGLGGVGRALIDLALRQNAPRQISFAALVDSEGALTSEQTGDPIPNAVVQEARQAKSNGERLSTIASMQNTHSRIRFSKQACTQAIVDSFPGGKKYTLLDCTNLSTTHLQVADSANWAIATCNKKAILSTPNIRHFVHNHGCESTCCAGTPVLSLLSRIQSGNDAITSIYASLSGTLNFLLSHVEAGHGFVETLKLAQRNGYTEPDPNDDLSGEDVRRKGIILAHAAGLPVDPSHVHSVPLRAENATQSAPAGKALRYVAEIDVANEKVEVGPKFVDKESLIGRLSGVDNAVEVYSECFHTRPLCIQGAGAGELVTAMGVLSDV